MTNEMKLCVFSIVSGDGEGPASVLECEMFDTMLTKYIKQEMNASPSSIYYVLSIKWQAAIVHIESFLDYATMLCPFRHSLTIQQSPLRQTLVVI